MSERRARRWVTESLVIVGSILLAFAIDAWWEERQEEGDAGDLARDLLADVRRSRLDADSVRASTEAKFEALMGAKELLRSPTPTVPLDSLNSALLRGIYVARISPVLDAYEQLVSRGLVARLHPEVREALAAWLQDQEEAREYGERDMLDYRQNVVFPFYSRPPLAMEQLLLRYEDLGDWGDARFNHSWAELHASQELSSILVTAAATARFMLIQYEQLDLRAADLEDALRRHYGAGP